MISKHTFDKRIFGSFLGFETTSPDDEIGFGPRLGGVSYLLVTKLGVLVVVVGIAVVTLTFFTDFLLPSLKDFVLLVDGFLFCIRLFNSFLKLNNGDAVALVIGNVLITGGEVVILEAVTLLDTSLFGLILFRFSINIPEVA